jgi:hypothetical protein
MSSDFFMEKRKEAAKAGEVSFLGAPCGKQEHIDGYATERYVLTGRCVQCERSKAKTWARKQVEKWRALREGSES